MNTDKTHQAKRYRLVAIICMLTGGFSMLLGIGGNLLGLAGFHSFLPTVLNSIGGALLGVGYSFHRRRLYS